MIDTSSTSAGRRGTSDEQVERTVINNVTIAFTMIGNDALRDERLSWGATGLLAYMLSHSGTWKFRSNQMKRAGYGSGRDAVRRLMRELEAAGYLERRMDRDEQGRLFPVTVVHYPPLVTPGPETPAPDPVAPETPAALEEHPVEDGKKKSYRTSSSRTGKGHIKVEEAMPALGADRDYDFDAQPSRPKREPRTRPEPGSKAPARTSAGKNPLRDVVWAFKDRTAHALVKLGGSPSIACDTQAMMNQLSRLRNEKGVDYPELMKLIDRWVIDLNVGNIKVPKGVAAWKVFLAQLDAIRARVDEVERRDAITYAPEGSLDSDMFKELV